MSRCGYNNSDCNFRERKTNRCLAAQEPCPRKIKVYDVVPVPVIVRNGKDIIYFRKKGAPKGEVIGKIDFTMKRIEGILFKGFKLKP